METLSTALVSWIAFHSQIGVALEASLLPGTSDAEIAMVGASLGYELPDELKNLYWIANGQADLWENPALMGNVPVETRTSPMFGHFRFLTLQEALAGHRERILMFEYATADTGNGYEVDLAPSAKGKVGQVIQVGPDFERHLIAGSLSELMSQAAAPIPPDQPGRFNIDIHVDPGKLDHIDFDMNWNRVPPISLSAVEIAANSEAQAELLREDKVYQEGFRQWLRKSDRDEESAEATIQALDSDVEVHASGNGSAFGSIQWNPDDSVTLIDSRLSKPVALEE